MALCRKTTTDRWPRQWPWMEIRVNTALPESWPRAVITRGIPIKRRAFLLISSHHASDTFFFILSFISSSFQTSRDNIINFTRDAGRTNLIYWLPLFFIIQRMIASPDSSLKFLTQSDFDQRRFISQLLVKISVYDITIKQFPLKYKLINHSIYCKIL